MTQRAPSWWNRSWLRLWLPPRQMAANFPLACRPMLEATRTMKPYATSMKVDFDNNRPLEVEGHYRRAALSRPRLGAPMPVIETLYRSLSFINSRITSS